jgi:hypothetical protein
MKGHLDHLRIKTSDSSSKRSWVGFTCGHCGVAVSGVVIAWLDKENTLIQWVHCPSCALGSTIIDGKAFPGAAFGPEIQGLPQNVNESYEEARRCMEVNALTAAELVCRKILMHVAVEKGAKEGDSFVSYISYLEKNGYITPPMKPWVDIIRKHGNTSTHIIEPPSRERAESTVMFTAELLRLTYEMEHIANKFISIPSPTSP